MKAELILNGKPKDVQAAIGIIMEAGICQSFKVMDDEALPAPADEARERQHLRRGPPSFVVGDRVELWYYRDNYGYTTEDLYKKGRVVRIHPSGRGYKAGVMLDNHKEIIVPTSVLRKAEQ